MKNIYTRGIFYYFDNPCLIIGVSNYKTNGVNSSEKILIEMVNTIIAEF